MVKNLVDCPFKYRIYICTMYIIVRWKDMQEGMKTILAGCMKLNTGPERNQIYRKDGKSGIY